MLGNSVPSKYSKNQCACQPLQRGPVNSVAKKASPPPKRRNNNRQRKRTHYASGLELNVSDVLTGKILHTYVGVGGGVIGGRCFFNQTWFIMAIFDMKIVNIITVACELGGSW